MKLDFVELSGGNYEMPAMGGAAQSNEKKSARTIAREAYFLEAAQELKSIAKVPLIVTGGITKLETANAVASLSDNTLVGIGTALGYIPDLPNRWVAGEQPVLKFPESWVLPGMLKFAANISCVHWNMVNIGKGKPIWTGVWPALAFLWEAMVDRKQMAEYKKWLATLEKGSGKKA